MALPLFHVDGFTDKPLAGNPAAVCLLTSWREDHWMQSVAAEMNGGWPGTCRSPIASIIAA